MATDSHLLHTVIDTEHALSARNGAAAASADGRIGTRGVAAMSL
jgi:hypothetical protein